MGLAIWLTTSQFGKLPYNNYEIIAYFIAAIYMVIVTEMWQSYALMSQIKNGDISGFLLRPVSIILKRPRSGRDPRL